METTNPLYAAAAWVVVTVSGASACAQAPSPERRAVAFLAREVPQWRGRNKCFSCHNNGDGARALYRAAKRSYAVEPAVLAETSAWLVEPERWDDNGGEEEFSDKKLARIQFAAALATAIEVGAVKDHAALRRAAAVVAADQSADGSWRVDAAGNIGSPTTYGEVLATHMARRTLVAASHDRFSQAIAKADRWLRARRVRNVLDAAGVLLALADATDTAAVAQRHRCLAVVREGQSPEGGWGPYVTASPEPFDTALVLLALAGQPRTPALQAMRQRGRAFLVARQLPDGSWPETTRPAGSDSYAQRLSTAGWATLALLADQSN